MNTKNQRNIELQENLVKLYKKEEELIGIKE